MKKTLFYILLCLFPRLAIGNTINLDTTKLSGFSSLLYQISIDSNNVVTATGNGPVVEYTIKLSPNTMRRSEQRSLLMALIQKKVTLKIPLTLAVTYCSKSNTSTTSANLVGTINLSMEMPCKESHTTGYTATLDLNSFNALSITPSQILECLDSTLDSSGQDCFP